MPTVDEYKCRNCGASLSLSAAVNGVLHCEYCHSSFTVPKKETSPAALDFIRTGEHELDTCSFDRAYAAYSKAAESDPTEPEAYFGMALSEFKVQYIRDTVNNRLQPICHEISDKVFTQNKNYQKALQLATPEQRAQYERKGMDIDAVRKEFLSLKNNGLHYDCFICVKVTDDETKMRTADYKIADDLYFHLRGKGYKPFFSEREIQNRTGADYEAIILYALYTSECMLVVCGKEEYLQTPWVKNEYTRYLEMINDEQKESDAITVVFGGAPIERLEGKRGKIQGIDMRGTDPYGKVTAFVESHTPAAKARKAEADRKRKAEEDEIKRRLAEQASEQAKQLEELKRKQEEAQRELENKLRSLQTQTPDSQSSQGFAAPSALQSLLVRAKQFLEMSDYNAARDYYNRALDNMPECAEAWWGLFLTDYRVATKEAVYPKLSLRVGLENAKTNRNYVNAKKYAAGAFAAELKDFANGLDTVLGKIEAEERAERERQRKAAEEQEELERIKREKERETEEARRRAEKEELCRREEARRQYSAEQAKIEAIRKRNFRVFLPFFILSLLFGTLSALFVFVPVLPSVLHIAVFCIAVGCFVIMTVFGIMAQAKFWLFLTYLISAIVVGILCALCEEFVSVLQVRLIFPLVYMALLAAAIVFSVIHRYILFIIVSSIICALALASTLSVFITYILAGSIAEFTSMMFLVCALLPVGVAFYGLIFKIIKSLY